MSVLNTQQIMDILPHRSPFLLIDTVEELQPGVKCVAKKNVTMNEPHFMGHFPGNPVVPGVILCEILAQSACVLLAAGAAEGATPFFTSLDKVRFKNPVKPGDVFETTCTLVKAKGPFYFCTGKGTVNGKLCVTADFSFALVGK